MSIQAWRIVKKRRAAEAFTGEGARIYGGRWNSRGTPVVYTAGSLALAMLETLVHLHADELLDFYVACDVTFDESVVEVADPALLPASWRHSPPGEGAWRIGDEWIAERRSAVLRVPSVVAPGEWNYLLNPLHSDFGTIIIGKYRAIEFDERLIKR